MLEETSEAYSSFGQCAGNNWTGGKRKQNDSLNAEPTLFSEPPLRMVNLTRWRLAQAYLLLLTRETRLKKPLPHISVALRAVPKSSGLPTQAPSAFFKACGLPPCRIRR